jgi:hypothetical protein
MKRKSSAKKIVALGVGAAAVGAGAFYLLGPNGKKHQKLVKNKVIKIEKIVEQKLAKRK